MENGYKVTELHIILCSCHPFCIHFTLFPGPKPNTYILRSPKALKHNDNFIFLAQLCPLLWLCFVPKKCWSIPSSQQLCVGERRSRLPSHLNYKMANSSLKDRKDMHWLKLESKPIQKWKGYSSSEIHFFFEFLLHSKSLKHLHVPMGFYAKLNFWCVLSSGEWRMD